MSAAVQLRRGARALDPGRGPWIRAQQIGRWIGVPDPATPIRVLDRHGEIAGWGLASERSAIAVRVLDWGPEPPPRDWLTARLDRALAAREAHGFSSHPTTGMRLVNSEGDGLPGLIVDRYDTQLVVQLGTAPMVALRAPLLAALRERWQGPIHVVQPTGAAKREGFAAAVDRDGDATRLCFVEHGLRMAVPTPPSHKTGAYFDQRANRRWVAALARHGGGPLLELGCHVGGFCLHAAAAGVTTVGVDQSATMLERAAEHARINGLDRSARAGRADDSDRATHPHQLGHVPVPMQWVCADMFGALDDPRLAGPFGTIVVDPPKLAARRSDVDRASAAMQRVVERVAERVRPGGHLVLCSCSHHLGRDRLDRFVLASTGDWTRIATRGADVDHPIAPGHTEGEYLRVAVYQRRT